MTFADLLAGRSYGDLPRERRIEVTRRAAELIRAWHPPGRASVPIIGIGAFPGVAVAIVRLPPEWYEAVVHLRQHLYGDRLLRASFVCQGFPLLTHITLGYVESDWKSIAACLTALRNGSALGMTEVDGASVFRFPHMSRFDAA
ncbi:MAG TPA: hypothetical protein VEK57_29380 [Thermoanaerobaculia bacterium]|nr:hypothetical protein [Thermoanaerobaculia bacterium]